MAADRERDDYIIEFHVLGSVVKVSIIDPVTLDEVSLVAPSSASRVELERLAIAKLAYVQKRGREGADAAEAPPAKGQKKPGIIV